MLIVVAENRLRQHGFPFCVDTFLSQRKLKMLLSLSIGTGLISRTCGTSKIRLTFSLNTNDELERMQSSEGLYNEFCLPL